MIRLVKYLITLIIIYSLGFLSGMKYQAKTGGDVSPAAGLKDHAQDLFRKGVQGVKTGMQTTERVIEELDKMSDDEIRTKP